MSTTIDIPNKSLFKANEVCALTDVKPYVLRFWETEFAEIIPLTSSTGQKLFEHKDIELILVIKDLLFEKKLTIDQAKAALALQAHHREISSARVEQEEEVETLPVSDLSSFDEESSEDLVVGPPTLDNIPVDFEKLVTAKNKLRYIVDQAERVFERNQWH